MKAAGRRLEQYIKDRIAGDGAVGSILELSRVTGIRPNTIYDWFLGRRSPRTDSLVRVAAALDVSVSQLLDAYEGRVGIQLNAAALAAIEAAVARGVETALRRLQEN